MRSSVRRGIALASVAFLLGSSVAIAHDGPAIDDGVLDSGKEVHGVAHHQHGGVDGHLPAGSENVDLISKLQLTTAEGRIADVGVWNGFAYLGAFRQDACSGPENTGPDGGVYIVDIRDPANPKKAGFIRIHQDSYVGEGVQALSISTAKFNGDILVLNSESCGKNGKGGFSLYDVSNPYRPRPLVEHFGDFNVNFGRIGRVANDIHSAFIWENDNDTETHADDRAYVVIVDDFEGTDVDIFDITDPKRPFLVGEFNLDTKFETIVDPTLGAVSGFLHDMVVKKIDGKYVMLVSYWDSGYVLLDVTDPSDPTYIADSDYDDPDPLSGERPEGNGHQAEFTRDNQYIIAADEDFTPFTSISTNSTDSTVFDSTSGSDTPHLGAGETLAGTTVWVGRACNGDPAVPAGDPTQIDVALVERGLCTFSEKVANVEAAGGYDAVIVFNRQGSDACSDLLFMLVEGGIPAFFVGRDVGLDLLNVPGYDEAACRAGTNTVTFPALGTAGDAVSFESIFDGWGYVRLFANGTDKLVELDQYAIPQAHDPAFATGFGDLSVHEVATSEVDDALAYFSYYAAGFRVARIVDDELVEVGHFIDTGGNNFWGVQVFQHNGVEYVAASDRDFGLYIFRYTGP